MSDLGGLSGGFRDAVGETPRAAAGAGDRLAALKVSARLWRAGAFARRHRWAIAASLAALLAVGALILYWPALSAWARAEQLYWQNALARAVQSLRVGEAGAFAALIGACAFYGLAHAVGPGHGKLLIAGAAAASRRTAWRMAGLGLAASLVQGLSAILLVYGGLGLLALSTGWALTTTEAVLAPLSFVAIALVGVWLLWRGVRGLVRLRRAGGGHAAGCAPKHGDAGGCVAGCRHAPTAEEAERVEGWRDALAMIAAIGVRPCSGALIVLVIAWRFELYWAGAAGAMAMAVGTGAVVSLVGLLAGRWRETVFEGADSGSTTRSLAAFAVIQIVAGAAVAALAAGFAFDALSTPSGAPLTPIR